VFRVSLFRVLFFAAGCFVFVFALLCFCLALLCSFAGETWCVFRLGLLCRWLGFFSLFQFQTNHVSLHLSTLQQNKNLAEGGYQLHQQGFPAQLRKRGVEAGGKLEHYRWRDDGQMLWDAITNYVSTFLDAHYTDSASVQEDEELRAWYREVVEGALFLRVLLSSLCVLHVFLCFFFCVSSFGCSCSLTLTFPPSLLQSATRGACSSRCCPRTRSRRW
jgi:hypothetical protein